MHLFFGSSLGLDLGLSAHVRLKSLGNIDASVLVNIVLEESDKSSGSCKYGIVKGVNKISSVFTLGSDTESSCLCVSES